ncbi:MAG: Uma2 family endonuclease [Dolichospermum sp.]
MTVLQLCPPNTPPRITWEKLPADFPLPDEPVENNLQPLLAAALRESLELAGLILESMLIASNFGLCATVDDKTIVKAPDWVYVPSVHTLAPGEIRRSYTPNSEGENPAIVMEFISATEGTEYSINPHFPYGKWHFYEQILKIPTYVIFHPQIGILEVHNLVNGKYQQESPDENQRFWIEALDLFLGAWIGKKAEFEGYWLRWWDKSGNLLLWGSELVNQERKIAEKERQRAEQAEQKAVKLAERLQGMGINLEDI